MDIYELLKKYYGYSSFRYGQEEIIRSIISGRDTAAVMPTGAGKSVCYQIPALSFVGITVVVSPLISLMQDQVRTLIYMGIRAAYLNSTLTPGQLRLAVENARRGVYKIIYVAPERLETEDFIDFASSADISLLAVDEAHCISQWGHDFRPGYMRIADFIEKLPKRPVVAAFTATATDKVKNDIVKNLRLRSPFILSTGFDRENLFFGVYRPTDKMRFILDYVENHPEQSGIIYCNSRKNAETVAGQLADEGYSALPYHAGMSDADRKHNQEEFVFDRAKIIVATTAFGMGIDKPNVRFVIHYNMPQNMEEYYQQAGRAGRDGEPSECILLYSGRDVVIAKYMIENGRNNDNYSQKENNRFVEEELEKLKLMTFYATSETVCLRKRLLGYFGERFVPPCGRCSVCNGESVEKYYVQSSAFFSKADKPFDEALFERLRQFRKSIANRSGIPAFAVISDTALKELAAEKPDSLSRLTGISGFGEAKIQRYGSLFIDVISEYENESDF